MATTTTPTTTTTPAATGAPGAPGAPGAAGFATVSLYVGDLNQDVTEALLFEIFNAVGQVASVRVCRDAATRRSLGYAYVNYHRAEDAERALDAMNFKPIRNRPCRIMWSHRDPSLRKSGAGNVFVKNLAKSIDNKTLYDTFSMFGNILSCKVAQNSTGESLGYGFVHYETQQAAEEAITRVDGKVIGGEKVNVAAFKAKNERAGGKKGQFTNLYVKNLPEDYNSDKLKALFIEKSGGEVTSCMVGLDAEGKSRGFGFVNMANAEDAAKAVEEVNGFEIAPEKVLFVGRAQKKEEREKELRDRFETLRMERQKKYAGVNLYVKNLSDDITDEQLREEFAKFGAITSCKVMKDGAEEGSKSKGFGFVCFSTPEEATAAVTEMNGHMLDSKPLYVALAQRKDVRRAQLDAQHSARSKMGVPAMFPQGSPMGYYQPQQMRGGFPYPGHMLPQRGYPGQMRGPMGMGGPGGYQLLPAGNMRQGPMGGPHDGRRGGRKGPGGRGGDPRNQQGRHQDNRNQRQPQQPQQQQQQPAPVDEPLTIKALAAAPEDQKKQMIGERLFPMIKAQQPDLAGKITGMLLEMDNGELVHLLESQAALNEKIQEALHVLRVHGDDQ